MSPIRFRLLQPARLRRAGLLLVLLVLSCGASADELRIVVEGTTESLLAGIRTRVESLEVTGNGRLSQRRLKRLSETAEREAVRSLRPYGYYHASARSTLHPDGDKSWRLVVTVNEGPPQIVASSTIEIIGPGAGLPDLQDWKGLWPLGTDQVMDQVVWESEKQDAIDLLENRGYLGARFVEHRIEMDLERNTAVTRLLLDTGPQAVMGDVTYEQDAVREGILELVPRFEEGQAYDAWLMEKFRLDLWRTGYFRNVEIIEERRLEEEPPRVNLLVRATARKPNTYQGTLGFGTDTGIRAKFSWTRHLLSARGDSLDTGIGWQEKFNEYSLRSNYRLPRRSKARDFWVGDFLVNRKRQELDVRVGDIGDDFIRLSTGTITDYSVRGGRLIVRDFEQGYQQIFETWFGQYVYETVDYNLGGPVDPLARVSISDELRPLTEDTSAMTIGVNWDWPHIRNSAFQTEGHHHRAWLFTAQKAWGSKREFTQAYVSSSWHRMLGQRWKLLLRGEVGYTDAAVSDIELEVEDQILQLSVTDLPNLYRFKAGGSRSVRGYSFESLSNNGIGSNNIVTASLELEMNFRTDWSIAAFYDVGNAFNDWNDVELRRGAGVGLRWYSLVGAVRLDLAQALDLEGDPWRIHFTIGTPLL
jgi:translocation and assembly module TamA